MRLPISIVPLLIAPLARADIAVTPGAAATKKAAPAAPRSPLGPRCDRALLAAQVKFADDTGATHWNTRERRYDHTYRWSDMCGVYGEYSIELAPDRRPDSAWHWRHHEPHDEGDPQALRIRAVRRANGWRATLLIERNLEFTSDDAFINAFQPALDTCLEVAASPAAGGR